MKIKNYLKQLLNPTKSVRVEKALFYSLFLLLPTQLGKHFWPGFTLIHGIRVDYLSPTIYLTDIVVGLLFIWWAARVLGEKLQSKSKTVDQKSKTQLINQKHFPYLICFFTISFLIFNILISGRILGSLYGLLKMLEMGFVACYTAKFIVLRKDLQSISLLFCFGIIFESVLAIMQYMNQKSIGTLLYFFGERTFSGTTPGIANASLNGELVLRPYGTFPHPNVLAGYLLVAMIMVLFSIRFLKPKKVFSISMISPLALILGTTALFLSMSRIAIVLWFIILTYFFLRKAFYSSSERSKSRSSNSAIQQFSNQVSSRRAPIESGSRMKIIIGTRTIIVLGFVAIISLLFLSPFGSRFTNISITDESVAQRSALIGSSFKLIKSSPLFGVGLGNFLPSLATIQKPLSAATYLQPVHNIFLLVASEIGLIGLAFFTWFIWKTVQRIKKQELRIRRTLYITLSSILLIGLFDHYWLTLQQGQLLFAFVVGLCWMKNDIIN